VLYLSRLKVAPTELSLSPVVYNDVGFAPGWHEYPLSALCLSVGLRFQGPKARFIPAWRNAPVQSMSAPAARTHLAAADVSPVGLRYQGPKARFIPAWRNAPGTGV